MMKNSSGKMKDDQAKYGVFSFLVMPFQPTASTDTYLYSTYTDLYILYIFFRYYPISFCDCAASSLPLSFVYLVFARFFLPQLLNASKKVSFVRMSVAMKNHPLSLQGVLCLCCVCVRVWDRMRMPVCMWFGCFLNGIMRNEYEIVLLYRKPILPRLVFQSPFLLPCLFLHFSRLFSRKSHINSKHASHIQMK